MLDHESSYERSAQSARSYEGMEHPANPTAARRSWPRGSSMRYWMISSARTRMDCGMVRPNALAGREHSSRMRGDGSPPSLTFDQAMLTLRQVAPVRLIRAVPRRLAKGVL